MYPEYERKLSISERRDLEIQQNPCSIFFVQSSSVTYALYQVFFHAHFPNASLATSHSLSTTVPLSPLTVISHSKLSGHELNPFVYAHSSGSTSSHLSCPPSTIIRLIGLMSKPHKILATLIKREFEARCMPGQARRPNPKGRSKVSFCRRGWPVLKGWLGRKREGSKVLGEGKLFGSCIMPLVIRDQGGVQQRQEV